MTQPVVLVLYEKLLPGTQVVNRLQDLGWRVHTVHKAADLVSAAEQNKPLLVMADLLATRTPVREAISRLRRQEATAHIPVIAFTASNDAAEHQAAIDAGATLVVNDTAIVQHLQAFIDRALSEF